VADVEAEWKKVPEKPQSTRATPSDSQMAPIPTTAPTKTPTHVEDLGHAVEAASSKVPEEDSKVSEVSGISEEDSGVSECSEVSEEGSEAGSEEGSGKGSDSIPTGIQIDDNQMEETEPADAEMYK
jgi:hypothetical protein